MGQLKLPQKSQNVIDCFMQQLKDTYGNGLLSVIIYGSAASGEFGDRYSNINILVVLDNAGLDNLSRISRTIVQRKFESLSPLFFAEGFIETSKDVFPIEFLDMKENYFVLFGKDYLKDLEIDLKNLRFQCEQELKTKLISIKNIFLRNKGRQDLKNLLFKSATSVMHILKNLPRIKGLKPAYLKEEILSQLNQMFGIDAANFSKILAAKQGKIKLSHRQAESMFFSLVSDLEKIIDMVDRFYCQ